jgi:hypothetical protein
MTGTYYTFETLAKLRAEELAREAAMAALAAELHMPQPGLRQRLARTLRGTARRLDPACESAIARLEPAA